MQEIMARLKDRPPEIPGKKQVTNLGHTTCFLLVPALFTNIRLPQVSADALVTNLLKVIFAPTCWSTAL